MSQCNTSRAQLLARLDRQIQLASFQRTIYTRRAASEVDPERALEWSMRTEVADADLLRLRREWLAIKLALCEWQARRTTRAELQSAREEEQPHG